MLDLLINHRVQVTPPDENKNSFVFIQIKGICIEYKQVRTFEFKYCYVDN